MVWARFEAVRHVVSNLDISLKPCLVAIVTRVMSGARKSDCYFLRQASSKTPNRNFFLVQESQE